MSDQNTDRTTVIGKISNILSGVFSPLLVPTYAYAIALWITYLSAAPEKTRLNSCIVVLILTAIVPMGSILFMMSRGRVSDPAISDRRERSLPFAITTICYLITGILLLGKIPGWLDLFFIAAAITALVVIVINLKWKISAHMTSIGGLCGMIIYIAVQHISSVMIMPWLGSAILFSGAVGSARIYLRRHTPAQVYTGWILGLLVVLITLSLSTE